LRPQIAQSSFKRKRICRERQPRRTATGITRAISNRNGKEDTMSLNIVQQIDERVTIRNVLISAWDKTDLDDLARNLTEINPSVKIYSTGGTFKTLQNALGPERAKRNLAQVSEYTGQPEMQGGLVKTLDFKIYLGLLSETYNPAHVRDLQRLQATTIDMVVVNLYPFARVIAEPGATPEMARTHIDIGGPCMIRAAAKNFLRVSVVTQPSDYDLIVWELKNNTGTIGLQTRFELARKAFAHTAEYDSNIAGYLQQCTFDKIKAGYQYGGGK
jgi:phosphoribosylaminoimidazolecarboxamide formyltransferase/IMP cyclohydrolase